MKRIVSALVIFGLPMCLIETYFSKQGGGEINSIIHFATGHSWAHMWYLYMLIGLYLITPVIKPFVVKASNKDWLAALGLFVCPVIIIPDFECRGVGLTGYMIFSTPYLFIYLLGYWLCWKIPQKIYGNKMLLIVIIILCIGLLSRNVNYRLDVYGTATPVVTCLVHLFLLFNVIEY